MWFSDFLFRVHTSLTHISSYLNTFLNHNYFDMDFFLCTHKYFFIVSRFLPRAEILSAVFTGSCCFVVNSRYQSKNAREVLKCN